MATKELSYNGCKNVLIRIAYKSFVNRCLF